MIPEFLLVLVFIWTIVLSYIKICLQTSKLIIFFNDGKKYEVEKFKLMASEILCLLENFQYFT